MATGRVVKQVRVAFLTDSRFEQENHFKHGILKRRALRALMRKFRMNVIEDSNHPDVTFRVYRQEGSKGWKLCYAVY